jgi:ABC-type sulfate/molybdate transport systems ATPase subunit
VPRSLPAAGTERSSPYGSSRSKHTQGIQPLSGAERRLARYPSGELIALLGPSGSGKTTLLRLIAGLESPTEGTVYFGNEDASRKTVQQRNIGFVFQHYALFRHMTVLDNVSFGLTIRPAARRPAKAEIRKRAPSNCSTSSS